MSSKAIFGFLLGLIVIVVISTCAFTVHQSQMGLVSRFGKFAEDKNGEPTVYEPGLHFKIPVIEKIIKFDVRLQTLDRPSSPVMTNEQKNVIIDYFVKWRIKNLPKFYTSTEQGRISVAETLLSQQVDAGLQAEIGSRNIRQVVTDDREAIMKELNDRANETAQKLGIEIIDVRIKRIDLPTEVSNAVFQRMRADRFKVATENRSIGMRDAEGLRALADAESTVIESSARSEGNKVRALGDAEAANIYAKTYNQDPEFYAFYRSLDAYTNTLNSKENMLLLSPDSQFFEYFNQSKVDVPKKKNNS